MCRGSRSRSGDIRQVRLPRRVLAVLFFRNIVGRRGLSSSEVRGLTVDGPNMLGRGDASSYPYEFAAASRKGDA